MYCCLFPTVIDITFLRQIANQRCDEPALAIASWFDREASPITWEVISEAGKHRNPLARLSSDSNPTNGRNRHIFN